MQILKTSLILIIGLFLIFIIYNFSKQKGEIEKRENLSDSIKMDQRFLRDGLKTNTSKSSIDLNKIISGGPGKDGIPAISNPKFTDVKNASKSIQDDTFGILVKSGSKARFYPYNILNWHEVVNDNLEGHPLLVTFCPLCGSAIVFERSIDGETVDFGVSGKLYESNLLMYDRKTESLWSQIIGEAVVGDYTGKKLNLYPSNIITFGELKNISPEAEILSDETGYIRNYDLNPYRGYEENETIYFPISINDQRFPAKEIFFIVNFKDKSVAFLLEKLRDEKNASIEIDEERLNLILENGEIIATEEKSNKSIPGYFAMWFSWAIHHQEDGIVWGN